MKQKQISSRLVYDGPFLKITRDDIQLSDGRASVREYVKHPGASLVLPVLPSGKLLAIRQYRYPLHREFIEFPAGKMDPGETPEQTAQRELEEEVGYQAGSLKKLTEIHPCIGYADEVIHIYLAENLVKTAPHPDPEEEIAPLEISNQELKQLILSHQLTDAKSLIAAFWYLNQKGIGL